MIKNKIKVKIPSINQENIKIISNIYRKSIDLIKFNELNLKLGDTIMFQYVYQKIKISNKGVVIKIKNTINKKYVKVFCNSIVLKLSLFDTSLVLKKISKSNKYHRLSHANYLIK